jgi:hypothetical protein
MQDALCKRLLDHDNTFKQHCLGVVTREVQRPGLQVSIADFPTESLQY